MELRKQFINNYVFPSWACAAGFNNNNNNNNNNSESDLNYLLSKMYICVIKICHLLAAVADIIFELELCAIKSLLLKYVYNITSMQF